MFQSECTAYKITLVLTATGCRETKMTFRKNCDSQPKSGYLNFHCTKSIVAQTFEIFGLLPLNIVLLSTSALSTKAKSILI